MMKTGRKWLALASAIVMLAVCVMSDLILPASAAAAVNPSFFYRFTAENYSALRAFGSNTQVTWDETVGAVKVSPAAVGSTGANQIELIRSEWSQMVSYPVFAMRIKKVHKDRALAGYYVNMNVSGGESYNSDYSIRFTDETKAAAADDSGEWHTVMLDHDTMAYAWPNAYYRQNGWAQPRPNWMAVHWDLMDPAIAAEEDDIIYIAWAGTFPSEADVAAYLAENPDPEEKTPTAPVTGSLFFDLSTEAAYNDIVDGTAGDTGDATALSFTGASYVYDSAEQALRVTVTDARFEDGRSIEWPRLQFVNDSSTVGMKDTGVFAMKVKIPKAMAVGWTLLRSDTSQANDGSIAKQLNGHMRDWQLVIIDVGKAALGAAHQEEYDTGVWREIGYWMHPAYLNVGDTFHIAWMGAFESAEAAQQHYEDTTDTSGIPTEPVMDEDAPPFFWSFEKENDVRWLQQNGLLESSGDPEKSRVGYDSALQALKLSAAAAGGLDDFALRVSPKERGKVSIDEYPVLAMRVKLSNKNAKLARLLWSSTTTEVESSWIGDYVEMQKNAGVSIGAEYRPTDEWQLVVIDGRNLYSGAWPNRNYTYNWKEGVLLNLLDWSEEGSLGDEVWIQWIGAFSTPQAVYSFAGEEMPDPDDKEPPSGFFFDFGSQAVIDAQKSWLIPADADTAVVYDPEKDAMKVTLSAGSAENGGSPLQIRLTGKQASATDYPIFAMRIKLSDERIKCGSFLWRTSRWDELRAEGLAVTYFTGFGNLSPMTYSKTENWQIVYFDTSLFGAEEYSGDLLDVLLSLASADREGVDADSAVWLEWAGLFASVEQLYAYAGISDDEGEKPVPFFWDLTTEAAIERHVEAAGDTGIAYDPALKALEVSPKDTNSDGAFLNTPGKIVLGLRSPVAAKISTDDYRYLAIRVKLQRSTQKGGMATFRTTDTIQAAISGLGDADFSLDVLDYAETTGWQTVIIDCKSDPTAEFFFTGDWKAASFTLMDRLTVRKSDRVWVRWAGAFSSAEEIGRYVAATKAQEIGDTADDGPDGDEKPDISDDVKTGEDRTAAAVACSLVTVCAVTAYAVARKKRSKAK